MPVAQDTALSLGAPAWTAVFSHRPSPTLLPDLSSVGDEALMGRWQNGDLRAFQALYRRHRASLHRYLLRMAASPAEAEEVFQEVWTAVVKGRAGWTPQATFRTYLFSIANRRLADSFRSRSRRSAEVFAQPLEGEDAPQVPANDLDPEAGAQNSDLGRALLAAIAALPAPQRQAFLLQAEAGLSLEEIATTTGVPRETVKSRLRYASTRLRAELRDWRE